jgi:23S rRNA pseudouridine1911/1915/1917 synthase
MPDNIVELIVPDEYFGSRADLIISHLLPEFSRSQIKSWIDNGYVFVEGEKITSKKKLLSGNKILVNIQPNQQELIFEPQNLNLNVVYSDNDIAIINKPPGLVVHPAAGNWSGTLLNGLLYHFPNNINLPRAGIVHRLDKDTSGLLAVALNSNAQQSLVQQLQSKTVYREYRAIVWGNISSRGLINEPIGRHPKIRTKMAINRNKGKEAITKFEPLEKFYYHTYVKCLLETGRTHQIRVHMQYNNTPIIGDPVYGYKKIIKTRNLPKNILDSIVGFKRQALHAKKISFIHPESLKKMHWEVDLPNDFHNLLKSIRNHASVKEDTFYNLNNTLEKKEIFDSGNFLAENLEFDDN